MTIMTRLKLDCGCGRTLTANGRAGRGAYRCGCTTRINVTELPDPVRRCTYGNCRTLATTKEPLRFCLKHEEQAAALLGQSAGLAKLRELEEGLESSSRTRHRRYGYRLTPLPPVGNHAPLVYFARRERLIKIGTTVRLRIRMGSLATTALATEPGDIVRETQLRTRFAHLLAFGREWFEPGPELIGYINELRQAEGLPAVAA
jgi:hypothetical protein